MYSKQEIIEAINRTAKENGGIPFGQKKFFGDTGITRYNLQKCGFSNYSEVLVEAGFSPNEPQVAHNETFVLESIIALIRDIKKIPTQGDLIGRRNKDSKFPCLSSIRHVGTKKLLIGKIYEYAKQKKHNDIVELCKQFMADIDDNDESNIPDSKQQIGEVYLFRSGRYYKIGRTNDPVRRSKELRIQLPERCELIHSIRTDDPSGIEVYWHKRFESKRMQGEWFNLNPYDVRAFKRWKHIY